MFQAKSLFPLVNCVSGHPSYYSYEQMAPHAFVKQYICFCVPCADNHKMSSYSLFCTPLFVQPLHLFLLAP